MKNWAPLLAALALTGCGAVAGAQGLTHRSISGALEVPASCEHPATVMKGNEKTWKPDRTIRPQATLGWNATALRSATSPVTACPR